MVFRMPPLKQLHAFEAAARHQSFKKAAEELHVTQAAISHQVRALEDHLGKKLFHRKTRQLVLTDAAREFAEGLFGAFAQMQASVERISSQQMAGSLKLSVAPFYANRMVLPLLRNFHEVYPDIRIMPEMDADVVILKGSDIDGAVRYGDGSWSGLASILLRQDQVGPVAAPELVQEYDLPMSPEEIAKLPLAYNLGTQGDWPRWFAQCNALPDARQQLIEYSDRAKAIDLALSGNGVALADTLLTEADVRNGHLVRLHPETVPSEKSMYVVYAETAYPDPRLIAFAEWYQNELEQLNRA
ncbi:hypothetical protein C1J05_11730 [Sulfitobacter sp. JL08]|nr:hypothetical protein C1J05_11730 [Sulfitobacter sp. JL08]